MYYKKLFVVFAVSFCSYLSVSAQSNVRYKHILITNDDGIEDIDRLMALAESVKSVADKVSIVVSSFDRSGTSNDATFGKYQSTVQVTCEYITEDETISVYTTPGNPADCVLIGLSGLFSRNRPDLVLSGINSGANMGADWFGSGTIGAARMAAFLDVKSVALSGFNEEYSEQITKWIVRFISSTILQQMGKNDYLTIGFPESEFKDVKLAERRITFDLPLNISFRNLLDGSPHTLESTSVWSMEMKGNPNKQSSHDDDLLNQGYIIITPMTIDENDDELREEIEQLKDSIPDFKM